MKSIIKILSIAAIILLVGIVSMSMGKNIPLENAMSPRGGMIELGIFYFVLSLVGVYWLSKVYFPNRMKNKSKNKVVDKKDHGDA